MLQQRLGRGGMGVVDLALDDRGHAVALKRLALCGSAGEIARARARVRREAAALGRLRHPHVVPLLGLIDDGDDLVLVMPYLAGGTLSEQVRAYGPLRPDQVLAIAGPLLDALAHAHRSGIVHRDIKPANVLFDLDGRPFLSDFGIASFRDATSGLTVTGAILGTPDFMAPEQARGEPSTPATDVFALGATLLFASTGQRPYGTADARVAIGRASNGKVETLPQGLDPRVARILRPLLRPNPDRRPTAAASAMVARSLAARPRRRAGWRAAGAVGLTACVACAALLGWRLGSTQASDLTSEQFTAASPTIPAPTSAAPTTAPCVDLAYQPCGKPAAANTDGTRCTNDHDDYDKNAANGCEAAPDAIDGQRLERAVNGANLVPATDVDRYPFHVDDSFSLGCDGQVAIALTAPPGTTMSLEVLDSRGSSLGTEVTGATRQARVTIDEPGCGSDDSGDFTAVVSYRGSGRSAARYTLTKSGSF